MDISALAGGTSQSGGKSVKQELGQEDFLTLMVTQMKNQDPFQPMQSGEFMAQIAQFTTASGVGELSKSFAQFQKDMATDQTLRAASLVGREVLVDSAAGYLPADGSLTAQIDVPQDVGNMTVGIYNEAGELVRKIDMGQQPGGQLDFSWDGRDDSEQPLPAGRYRLSATTELDGETYSLATLMSARVDSVTMTGNGQSPVLNLEGIGEISLAAVQQIR